jgi:hypothetical protein
VVFKVSSNDGVQVRDSVVVDLQKNQISRKATKRKPKHKRAKLAAKKKRRR